MKEQQLGSKKKFLYNDHKKSKQGDEERTFHSRGYEPSTKKSLIDLESVWSVKDMVLDSPAKPTADLDTQVKASTSYYSRHGGYKTNTVDKVPIGGPSQSPSQWSSAKTPTQQQKLYQSNTHSDPLDF